MEKPILIHTHFHKRKTGVTRSVENVIPFFNDAFETYVSGYGVSLKTISFLKTVKLLFSKRKLIVHCHRNNEIIRIFFLRLIGAKFKLVGTRHAETKPSKMTMFLLKKCDEIVTLTKNMHQTLGVKNTLVSHGVNTESFVPKKNTVLKNIKQKNIILCAGRVRKAKGQKILLEASVSVLQKNKDWCLVIVGKVDKPEFKESLNKIVKDNGIKEQVYFVDETNEIIKYYQASTIAVVPSFSEGFSLVCAEAMSCGCTTIATANVGVHSDLINHNNTGYLFEAGNVNELNELLMSVVKRSLPYTAEKGRSEILKNWSANKEASELALIYNK